MHHIYFLPVQAPIFLLDSELLGVGLFAVLFTHALWRAGLPSVGKDFHTTQDFSETAAHRAFKVILVCSW